MFFIGGTKARPRTVSSGTFYCPREKADRRYDRVKMKRSATVFFVPVVDIGELGEYVECRSCGATYDPAVLELATDAHRQDTLSLAILSLAAATVTADGNVTAEERQAVLRIVNDKFGLPYTEDDLDSDLDGDFDDLSTVLANAGSLLNVEGREVLIKAAVLLSAVDGQISGDETDLIMRSGRDLGLSRAHVRGIVAESVERLGQP
jgi:uncharacterized tellurite resistance protein B-like protein